jgi:hypothetical protein
LNSTDLDGPSVDAGTGLSSAASRATARRLRRTRQRLGSYRHDLLVAMRIVNSVESQMVLSEWENWLADENARCDQAGLLLGDSKDKAADKKTSTAQQRLGGKDASDKNLEGLREWYREYCGSCRADQSLVEADSARRSMTA